MATRRLIRRLALVGAMVCAAAVGRAQWWQAYSEKTGLVLCLHMDEGVELYSPMQTTEPIKVTRWSLGGDTLRLECGGIGLKATLVRRGNRWVGNWRQGLVREEVTFTPADTLYTMQRPQTPQPPYAFYEEEVTADYTDSQGNAVHLEGSLTVPRMNMDSYPCLVLVSGSGQQNRDEELLFHRPFLVLADRLARCGIAVLRYDDRGVGGSTGPLDSADTRLFAEDAEAMLDVARRHPRVDTLCLGIGGHSEGGAIAPMVAARRPEVAFVVMLAGQGCTGLEVLVQQNEALFRSRGVSERLCRVRGACMRELLTLPPTATVKQMQQVIARHTDALSKAEADSIELRRGMAHTLKQQLESRWMRSFVGLDPAGYLPQVRCPLLALGGDKDCQVLAEPNLKRIKELCPQAEVRQMPGLNHLFQHCQTGNPSEYVLIDETFAPEAMEAVCLFVLANCIDRHP